MTRKIISLCLIVAMLFTMIPMTALASGDASAYLEVSGFPTDWTNQHSDFTITAKDGVTAMSVNGAPLTATGATIGGGFVTEGGKPYVKYKVLNYDEATGVMNIGAFIGNIKSGKGHGSGLFTFKYDKANWAPYDLIFEEELTTTEYGLQDFFFMGYSAADRNAYNITTAQIAKAKAITLETSESGAMLDLSTGVVAVTWYTSIAEIDATTVEVPILRFALIKKGNGTVNANTITQPLTTELTNDIYTAGLFDKTVTSSTQMSDSVAGVVYTTGNDNIDYVVQASDGTMYGCAQSSAGTFKFEGNTASADAFEVSVTAGGSTYTKTYNVLYDDVKPTISVVPEQSDAPVQQVTFTITANDNKSGIDEIFVNGNLIEGDEYTVTESGTYEFKAIDKAGNESDVVTRTVTVDAEGPELEITGNATDWTNKDVVLTIITEDGATVTVNGEAVGKTYTVTENGTYTFVATDAAGNTTTETVVVNKIDKVALSFEYELSTTEWTNEDITVTINATAGASGVAKIEVGKNEISGNTFNVSQNGTYKVKVTNGVGDIAESNVVITNIDKTKPTVRIDVTPVAPVKEYTFKINATDGESGIDKILVNDVEIKGYEYVVNESKSGFYSYSFKVIDKAGNVAKDTKGLNIDLDPPELKITGNATAPTKDDVVLNIKTEDGATVTVNGEAIDGTTYTVTENGTYIFVATDRAGNESKSVEVVVDMIDRVAPELKVTGNATTPTKNDVVLNIETESGATVTVNGEAVSGTTFTATENGTYTFVAIDEAGNESEAVEVEVTMIDKVAPMVEILNAPDGWLNASYTLNISVNESATVVAYKDGVSIGEVTGTTLTVAGSGVYSFVATDEAGNESEPVECEVLIDTVKPVVDFSIPEEWVAAGYEAVLSVEDNDSGIASITVNGEEIDKDSQSFEVYENDEYTVVVTDNAGNTAEISKTINKIDDVAPVISNVSAPLDDWADAYNLTFTVTDAEMGVESVTVNGEIVDGPVYSYEITENGDYVIEVTDKAGNVSTEPVNVVYIDEEAPVVYDPAVPDEKCQDFTLEITAEDSQSGVVRVTVNGLEATLNGDIWEFFVEANGNYDIKAYDKVGRESEVVSVYVENIDNDKPVITFPGFEDVWTNDDVVIALEINKEIEALTVAKDGGAAKDITGESSYTVEENGTYTFTATDEAGNVGTKSVSVTKIDKVNPTIEVSGKPAGYVNAPYNVTISADDNSESNLTVVVSVAGADDVVVSGTTYPITEEGTYTFTVTDEAGNSKSFDFVADNFDFEAPEFVSAEYDKAYAKSFILKVVFDDNKTENLVITVDGEPYTESGVEITEDGSYIFVATDEAGNKTEEVITITNIDNKAPEVLLNEAPENWTNNFVLSITATDDEAGIDEIKVNGEVISGTTVDVAENGTYTVVVTDKLGNATTKEIVVDKLDKVLPELPVSEAPTEWTLDEFTFEFTPTDALSGIKEVTVNGIAVEGNTYKVTENGTYTFVAIDNAGNRVEKVVEVNKLDKEAPVFGGEITATETTEATITVAIPEATDDMGVASVQLFLNDVLVEAYNGEATYKFEGLEMGTSYKVKVVVTDIAGRTAEKEITVGTIGLGKIEVSVDMTEFGGDAKLTAWNGDEMMSYTIVDGKLVFANLTAGTYNITFKTPGFFPVAKAEIVVLNGETKAVELNKNELVAGDSTSDNKIDIFDLNAVASAFAESYEGEAGLKYDFNRDGKINLEDVKMLVKNYLKIAE